MEIGVEHWLSAFGKIPKKVATGLVGDGSCLLQTSDIDYAYFG